VDVEAAVTGDVEERLRQQLAVGCDHHEIGGQATKALDEDGIPGFGGLIDGYAYLEGGLLDRGGL
jgi:hypothetical protein